MLTQRSNVDVTSCWALNSTVYRKLSTQGRRIIAARSLAHPSREKERLVRTQCNGLQYYQYYKADFAMHTNHKRTLRHREVQSKMLKNRFRLILYKDA